MPGLMESIFGKGDRFKQLSTKSKRANQQLENYFKNTINQTPLYQSGSNFLQSLLSNEPNAFASFEAPYQQQFQQQIAPQIAERFTGMGTGAGAQSSSALNNALASAGGNLQNQLASLRSGLQMQALPQALGYAQQPFSNQLQGIGLDTVENVYQPGSTGYFGELMKGLGGSASMGFGQYGGNFLGQKAFGPMAGRPGGI